MHDRRPARKLLSAREAQRTLIVAALSRHTDPELFTDGAADLILQAPAMPSLAVRLSGVGAESARV